MIAFVRLVVFGFIAMTIMYVLLSIYSRSVERERLEKEWDGDHDGGETPARDAYIEAGMRDYEKSLRKKLIWLVYVVPTLAVLLLIYLTN
jgi:Ca2+/Na+ antiporter